MRWHVTRGHVRSQFQLLRLGECKAASHDLQDVGEGQSTKVGEQMSDEALERRLA